MSATLTPTRSLLADGREILFFSLPGHTAHPVPDKRPLSRMNSATGSEIRYDRQTGDWVAIAALRQDRTYKPPADQCPLCPSPTGDSSEVPAADYDVVVFENRFPSLSHANSPFELPTAGIEFISAPGIGRCEVVCFSSEHTTSFAELTHAHARLVVDVWRERTAELLAIPSVAQVFCFENRGEEIGVTLSHPHGQIYGYPYLTPRTTAMLAQATAFAARSDSNLFADILSREVNDGRRILVRTEHMTAFVPFAARWPVEVHIYPNRRVHNLTELTTDELDDFTTVYLDMLQKFDGLYPTPLPYISALHQYDPHSLDQHEGYFHVELLSVRRSATKLKYLAGSESAMDAFITDVTPESVAELLRGVIR